MEILIAIVIFGFAFAYFATQNVTWVSVRLANYTFLLPVYVIVIISLLLGLFLSWIFALIENVSASLTIWGKESVIKQDHRVMRELNERIHELELANARLNDQNDVVEEKKRLKREAASYV